VTGSITLRYFAARGRAQFLRYFLRARQVPFTDERVPLSADFAAWQAIRNDRTITGPFQKLPVLVFDDRLVAETLPIADFLHVALGDPARLSTDDNLQHKMLLSSVYQDVMTPIGTLLWAEALFPGVDLAALAKRTLERMHLQLQAIGQTLLEWQWLERARSRPVMVADCLLWEELDVAQHVLGPKLALQSQPTLLRFHREFSARGVCEALKEEHPCPVTARPGEPDVIARIQALLA
jgi:glutathione S-transferase